MQDFEKVLAQYEPMISASLRTLNIYRDHEQYRQAGRVALWQAWTRFDDTKGDFTPYAYRSIRGAMLDELKRVNRVEEHVTPVKVDVLEWASDQEIVVDYPWSDQLEEALESLSLPERQLIQWLFVERISQAECAERAGISVAGVKKRRQRLLEKLRKGLR